MQQKAQFRGERFEYTCPFLIEGSCSVYSNRGLTCRVHGLAHIKKDGSVNVPYCANEGLNYSNVYDFETDSISVDKFKALGVEQEPLAHNVGLSFMSKNDLTEKLNLDFGEFKPMYKWFLPE